jgi:hypothetical protein
MKWKNITLVILIPFYSTLLHAQHKNDTISDWDRTFMPAIQMGYVEHGTDQLSGGLMIQTSIEFRHKSNFVLRINYDDFDSKMKRWNWIPRQRRKTQLYRIYRGRNEKLWISSFYHR